MTIREHEFDPISRICIHCGDGEAGVMNHPGGRSCVAREIPRPVPESAFADLGAIGERMRAIKAEEGRGAVETAAAPEPGVGTYDCYD